MKRWIGGLAIAASLQACGAAHGPVLLPQGRLAAMSAGADPLAAVLAQDRQLVAQHQHPIVIFDLDDTLFCTAYRNLEILKEWSATAAGAPYRAGIAGLAPAQVAYDIDGALTTLGVPASQRQLADRFWSQRFFNGAYLQYDHPEPGAAAYVQSVAQSGAEVVYMTGRPAMMAAGTQRALTANGFPWSPGKGTELVQKTTREPDAQFKSAATQQLEQSGTVVGCFDNEPANVNAFHQVAPRATVVFLNTVHSPNAPAVDAGIFTVDSFGS